MTDNQIKSTDICKQVFLAILPIYAESAKKDIRDGYLSSDEAFPSCGVAATEAAIKIARQWLEY